MARSIAQIKSNLYSAFQSICASIGIVVNPSIWSISDYKKLILDTIATQQAIEEQLYDEFIIQTESIIAYAPPQTAGWFKNIMINLFEYDSVATPVVQLSTENFFPYYASPNPTYNVVKYCSVNSGIFGTVNIKIAGIGPTQLDSTTVSAAQSFVNIIGVDGIVYNVQSYVSDKIYIVPTIYFSGIYSSVIKNNIITAISAYLANIPFNGVVTIDELLISIKNVVGVLRVILNTVSCRKDSGETTNMVVAKTWITDLYQTYAGYIIPETTSGLTLNDVLDIGTTLIPQ